VDHAKLESVKFSAGEVELQGERQARGISIRARLLIDATGPRGFLHRTLSLKEIAFEHLPPTQTLFSHFTGVRRIAELNDAFLDPLPPYAPDAAALHHVFDGGWIWVLRFNNGVTSAGVAAKQGLAEHSDFSAGKPAWDKLLARLPLVHEQFIDAVAVQPFMHWPRLSFQSGSVAGANWVLLPSAAGFIDPLLSTGFALTLLGIERLGRIIQDHWGRASLSEELGIYARQTTRELRTAERLVAALYASMHDFPLFTRLSLLYFAPVSFSEIARRLGHAELASAFLLRNRPEFAEKFDQCCDAAMGMAAASSNQRDALMERILETIAAVDLIGLSDLTRRNWYPVKADDLRNAAHKLGLTPQQTGAL
jgi:FADH2 O2-dependent halogenase